MSITPADLDFFDDDTNFRTIYKHVFERIDNTGKWTTAKLQQLVDEEQDGLGEEYSFLCNREEHAQLEMAYQDWLDMFVQEWSNLHEIKSYTLPIQVFGTNEKGLAHKLRNTIGMHIFYELSRLCCLKSYKQLMLEKRRILALQSKPTVVDQRKYLSLFSLSCTLHPMWGDITEFIENVISQLEQERLAREEKQSGYIDPYLIALRKQKQVREKEDEEDDKELAEMQQLLQKMKMVYEKPVFSYTQTEVVMAIQFLTYYLCNIPTTATMVCDYENDMEEKQVDAIQETRMYFDALFIRNSLFFCEAMTEQELDNEDLRTEIKVPENMLDSDSSSSSLEEEEDEPVCYYQPNRLYCAFSSFYFGAMLRRFYHYDSLKENQMDLLLDLGLSDQDLQRGAQRCEQWLKDIVLKMPPEAIDDIYAQVCDEAYMFPGDERYFSFKYPRKIKNTGAYLQWMRPALSKQFYAEGNVSVESIFSTVDKKHVSRWFVLHLLHNYLKIQANIKWMSAVLVDNEGIELSAHRLMANRSPLLVQPFSRYWPYDRGMIYQCDGIYESVAIWFWLLKQRYGGSLHGKSLHRYIEIIWPSTVHQEHVIDNQVVALI